MGNTCIRRYLSARSSDVLLAYLIILCWPRNAQQQQQQRFSCALAAAGSGCCVCNGAHSMSPQHMYHCSAG